jgi:hypothetical protein
VTILVCAATRSELGACARGIHAGGAAAGCFETLLTGVGLVRAAKSVGDRLEREDTPSLIVSSGFAGVLSAGIAVGVWVTATRVAELHNGACVDIPEVTLREAPPPGLPCTIFSSSVLQHGSSAGALARYGDGPATVAVDMESAAIAREAARFGIPMMVLRLVSDTPEQPLPGFLSPLAAAMASTRTRARVAHTASAVRGALGDPRGVASLVRNGSAWSKELARGWERFARLIA